MGACESGDGEPMIVQYPAQSLLLIGDKQNLLNIVHYSVGHEMLDTAETTN